MSIARAAVLLLLFAAPWLACAATTSTVVDCRRPMVSARCASCTCDRTRRSARSWASPAANGVYSIQDSGDPRRDRPLQSAGAQPAGLRGAGIATVLVNDLYGMTDVQEIIRHVRSRERSHLDCQRSASTTISSAWLRASRRHSARRDVRRHPQLPRADCRTDPAHHRDHPPRGRCRPHRLRTLQRVDRAPYRERVALTGGSNSGCGYHLLEGLDAVYVDTVAGLNGQVQEHAGQCPDAGVTAVEFYNANLDHYFLTHVPARSRCSTPVRRQGLVRSGQSFNV